MSERYRGENFSLHDSLNRAENILGSQYDEKDLFREFTQRNREKGDVEQILSELEQNLEGIEDINKRARIINDWKSKYFPSEHR